MVKENTKLSKSAADKSGNDAAEAPCAQTQAHLREELENQVDAFLASGGEIQHIDPHVTADPPKKPSSNYGSRPI